MPSCERLNAQGTSSNLMGTTSGFGSYITLILLSSCAALLLPRQFHMTVVENHDIADLKRAAWLFPLYLILINIFVIPIALAGLAVFPERRHRPGHDACSRCRSSDKAGIVAVIAFLGGFSAATAMVIVDSVAVAVMISNHLVMPIVLRRRAFAGIDPGSFVIGVRRVSIVVVILLGYVYYRASGEAALAAIGLLSFAAIAQVAPAFLGGLIWSRGTALGASVGLDRRVSSPGPIRSFSRASSGMACSGPMSSSPAPSASRRSSPRPCSASTCRSSPMASSGA